MAKKTISAEKLAAMAKDGASVTTDDGRLNTVISSEISRMEQTALLEKIRTELELRENDLDRREAEYRIRLADLTSTKDKDKDKGPTEITGFGDLLGRLDAMAKASVEQSKSQLEVLATLQMLIRKGGEKPAAIDMGPIKVALSELKQVYIRPKAAYDFEIKRGTGGFMTSIVATPINPTTH